MRVLHLRGPRRDLKTSLKERNNMKLMLQNNYEQEKAFD
jgi:hypothetical protein